MKRFFNKKNIIVFSLITIVVLFFSLFYKPKQPLPIVLHSIPTQNAQNVSVTDDLQLKFDQIIDISKLSVSSSPPEVWSTKPGKDPSIIILKSKQYLHADTQYSLSVLYENQPIFTLNFKTITQQGDPRYTQEILLEMERDYPLAVELPHTTSNYRIIYSAPLTIEVTIKNPNLTSDEVIEEVKSWVTQNGGDSSAHKYTIALPSPSPTN